MKNFMVMLALGILLAIMISSFMDMPTMGDPDNPSYNEVARHYLEQSLEETYAPNTVTVIISDYRAMDTLGEATVLFASIVAVLTILSGKKVNVPSKEKDWSGKGGDFHG